MRSSLEVIYTKAGSTFAISKARELCRAGAKKKTPMHTSTWTRMRFTRGRFRAVGHQPRASVAAVAETLAQVYERKVLTSSTLSRQAMQRRQPQPRPKAQNQAARQNHAPNDHDQKSAENGAATSTILCFATTPTELLEPGGPQWS